MKSPFNSNFFRRINHAKYGLSKLKKYSTFSLFIFLGVITHSAQASNNKANKERIVAIDGSISEIVYALGKGDLMVGRDTTTTYPEAAAKLPSVGYMRQLSAEGILSLKPTLVLATKDAKPQNVLTRLKNAGVHIEIIDNAYTAEGVVIKIKQVANILQLSEQGEQLAKEVQESIKVAKEFVQQAISKQQRKPAKALFILNMRGNSMMVAGKNSRADTMMQLAGITNPAAQYLQGYKPLTAEAAIQYNPDYLLTMQHGISAAGGKDEILNTPAIKMTTAGKNKQLLLVDDNFLMFGPRMGEAIKTMARKIYATE